MKKFASLILAVLVMAAALNCAMAEEAAFDPCASLWYWDHTDNTQTYDDGTVTESHVDYSLPTHSYATFEFKTDGTFVQTTETALGKIYTSDGTWEYISENQIQCKQIVADE